MNAHIDILFYNAVTANFNGAFQPIARKLWGKVLFADRNQGPFATRPYRDSVMKFLTSIFS